MTRLKVTVDKQEDLLELQALFSRMGLKYWIDENNNPTDPSEQKNKDVEITTNDKKAHTS
jgi:hypothetical protein